MNPTQKQFYCAFNEGNLTAAQELFAEHPGEIDLHWNKEYVFVLACEKGYLEFAQWLISQEPTHGAINIHARHSRAFQSACRNRHLSIARWLLTLEPTHGAIDIHMKKEEIFRAACRRGHLDVLEWLLSLESTRGQIDIHIQCERAYQNSDHDISPFNQACRKGHLDVVKFLVALEPTHAQLDVHFAGERAFRWACGQGHLHLAQWLLTLEPTHRKFNLTAVFKGHPCQFETWHTLIGEYDLGPWTRRDDSALNWACRNGHPSLVQWLIELAKPTKPFAQCAFSLACQYGHLPIAQLLLCHEHTGHQIDVHQDAEEPFYRACAEGHLGIAQWLLSLGSERGPIDIHAGNEAAFRAACARGRMNVARWLLTLEAEYGTIDIHILDSHAFCLACHNNHIEMAQWIFDLVNKHGSIRLPSKECLETYCKCLSLENFTIAAWLLCRYPEYFDQLKIGSPICDRLDTIVCERLGRLVLPLIARTDSMEPKTAMRLLKLFLQQKHLSRRARRIVTQALVRHARRLLGS